MLPLIYVSRAVVGAVAGAVGEARRWPIPD
jgi:hypothetical protein